MKSTLDVQYTFLGKSRTTAAGHLASSSLELRYAETKAQNRSIAARA
jgi:hypothetical protein